MPALLNSWIQHALSLPALHAAAPQLLLDTLYAGFSLTKPPVAGSAKRSPSVSRVRPAEVFPRTQADGGDGFGRDRWRRDRWSVWKAGKQVSRIPNDRGGTLKGVEDSHHQTLTSFHVANRKARFWRDLTLGMFNMSSFAVPKRP